MNDNNTYFVIDGTCTIVQKIVPQIRVSCNGQKLLERHAHTSIGAKCGAEKSAVVFVAIRNLVSGDCFGLGK